MKLSIIVPVYNTGRYIRECLDSITKTNISSDFEVIVVNDGSTDDSKDIIIENFESDHRVHIYSKDNSGVADTRNFGLDRASGDFILFVDADDLLEPNAVDHIISTINDGQLYQFSVSQLRDGLQEDLNCIQTDFASIDQYFNSHIHRGEIWNYIFNLNIIKSNNLYFSKGIKFAEDREFVIKYFSFVSKIHFISQPVYIYRINSSSAMHATRNISDAIDHIVVLSNLMSFYKSFELGSNTYLSKQLIIFYKICCSFIATANYQKSQFKIVNQYYSDTYNAIRNDLNIIDNSLFVKVLFHPLSFRLLITYYSIRL